MYSTISTLLSLLKLRRAVLAAWVADRISLKSTLQSLNHVDPLKVALSGYVNSDYTTTGVRVKSLSYDNVLELAV